MAIAASVSRRPVASRLDLPLLAGTDFHTTSATPAKVPRSSAATSTRRNASLRSVGRLEYRNDV